MHKSPTLSLIVLRVSDIERALEFYKTIGFTFEHEQHGAGPEHFSTRIGDTVFELYPASERWPVTTTRIGFSIDSVEPVLSELCNAGCKVLSEPKESPYGLRAVVADPDGHRVELSQRNPDRPARRY